MDPRAALCSRPRSALHGWNLREGEATLIDCLPASACCDRGLYARGMLIPSSWAPRLPIRVRVALTDARIAWKVVRIRRCGHRHVASRKGIARQERQAHSVNAAEDRQARLMSGWLDLDRVIGVSWKSPVPLCSAVSCALLVIHTFTREGIQGERLEPSEIEFYFDSIEEAQSLEAAVWAVLRSTSRPRNLLVLVNPYGGKRQGREKWGVACEVLSAARVKVHVVETKYAGHAGEIVTQSLFRENRESGTGLDGLVCVGGDGLVNEVLEALYTCKHVSHIPLGIVPAGSTDATAMSIMGTNDASTAAIHIALGASSQINLIEVRTARLQKAVRGESTLAPSNCVIECLNSSESVRYVAGALLYGYFGEVMRRSESDRMRNLFGPSRYDVAGAVTLAALPKFKTRVRFRQVNSRRGDVSAPIWSERIGRYTCVNMFGLPCVSPKTPSGIVPELMPGAGYFVLILLKSRGGRLGMLRHLLKMSSKGISAKASAGGEFIRAEEVIVEQLGGREGCWNADGELIRPFQPGMILRSKLCGKITMMGHPPSARTRKARCAISNNEMFD